MPLTILSAACSHAVVVSEPIVAPEPAKLALLDEGSDVPENSLRDAMEENVGIPDMGPATVVQSWTWRPRGSTAYVVWVTCRGEGDARLCSMAAAPTTGGFVIVQAKARLGHSPARTISADEESLRLSGDDAKGPWTQSLSVIGHASIALGDRSYEQKVSF